ncbi:MAG: hypothetical protein M1393_09045 [Candidatus Thermoplasmatota archaeon]|nr:hypothetical protein [Candidatus Thermoplasmatota archaeon]
MNSLRLKIAAGTLISFLIFNIILILEYSPIISLIPASKNMGWPFFNVWFLGFVIPTDSLGIQWDLLDFLSLMFLHERLIIPSLVILSSMALALFFSRKLPPLAKKKRGEASGQDAIKVFLEKRP